MTQYPTGCLSVLVRFALACIMAFVLTASMPVKWVEAQTPATMTVTSVATDADSVQIVYQPVVGAKDYRAIVDGNTMAVKYAGMWHLDADQLGIYSKIAFATNSDGSIAYPLHTVPVVAYSPLHHIDVPALEIQPNGLAPGQHTIIIQAVDALGPCPPANLYDANNLPTMNAAAMAAMGGEGMDTMLGANAGTTPDGLTSTNGQGPSTNKPNVIAQSQPIVVTTTGIPAFPSPLATSSFIDTFSSGTFAPVGTPNITTGNENFTLTTPVGSWDVFENHCDIRDTKPFVMNRHYMAVDFDGETPGSNQPLHVAYSGVAISPQKTASIAGGVILHCTMEVDAHTDTRRWVGILVCDAAEPLTALDWEEGEHVNAENTVLSVQWEGNDILVDEIIAGKEYAITGAAGQASHAVYRIPVMMGWQFGRGLDDRSHFDLFLSQTHFSVYEDGVKEAEFDLPVPLPFTQAKVYDAQYLYHSDLERTTLEQQYPYETDWINNVPYSDERHWSACGWEVLPAATTWASLGALIPMPKATAPVYVPANPTVTLPANWASGLPVAGGVVDQAAVEALIKVLEGLLPAQ